VQGGGFAAKFFEFRLMNDEPRLALAARAGVGGAVAQDVALGRDEQRAGSTGLRALGERLGETTAIPPISAASIAR
jgi:hypothetical protein